MEGRFASEWDGCLFLSLAGVWDLRARWYLTGDFSRWCLVGDLSLRAGDFLGGGLLGDLLGGDLRGVLVRVRLL